MRSYRLSLFAIAIMAVGLLLALPNTVSADPHAVFYTATAQRQLFFNVLAALDQADYVEPAEFRARLNQELEKAKEKEGATLEDVVSSTNTDLATVLTRPVTLQGDDQFTAYLEYQRVLEIARRAGTKEAAELIFCEALGRPNCDDSKDSPGKLARAFTTRPIDSAAEPFLYGGVGALSTGTKYYSDKQKEILDKDGKRKESFPAFISDNSVGDVRKLIKGSAEANSDFDQRTLRSLASTQPLKLPGDLYGSVKFKPSGDLELDIEPKDSSYLKNASQKVSHFLYSDLALAEVRDTAAAKVTEFKKVAEKDGLKADVRLLAASKGDPCIPVPVGLFGVTCTLEEFLEWATDSLEAEIIPHIEVPVAAKLAEVQAGLDSVVQSNTNRTFATLENQQKPFGEDPLLEQDLKVAGARDTNGKVLGVDDRKQKAETGPGVISDNPAGPNQDLSNLLNAYQKGFSNDDNCDCALDGIANDYGTTIINKIRGL